MTIRYGTAAYFGTIAGSCCGEVTVEVGQGDGSLVPPRFKLCGKLAAVEIGVEAALG
ncbi:MAG TPA: hypothetical protein VHQ70_08585 [Syntrophomonadaceae bacterium]|nr:hypothetical protein [Syntrophomonadaceae bacterium]